tara:strand:+ start:224 stop:1156 length:933 start_codon:yes stop_codon:yes gene_type:complete
MFSVVFPGQGSQSVGMGAELYKNFSYVKDLFNNADEILGLNLTKIILEGPKENLDLTEFTQPAIFLISYSIFEVIKNETKLDFLKAKYFAGHSLGEYSALACSGAIKFEYAIKLLQKRGKAMQMSMPKGKGGMIAILGSDIDKIKNLLIENENKYKCYIANDNSVGQIVVSGEIENLNLMSLDLKKNSIKNIKLPVSAPFHCPLMSKATEVMKEEINKTEFNTSNPSIISNVTGEEVNDVDKIKELLIKQIESPVRWRESVLYMKAKGVKKIIEIGPGKVLSGLIKRIDRSLFSVSLNTDDEIKNFNLND